MTRYQFITGGLITIITFMVILLCVALISMGDAISIVFGLLGLAVLSVFAIGFLFFED